MRSEEYLERFEEPSEISCEQQEAAQDLSPAELITEIARLKRLSGLSTLRLAEKAGVSIHTLKAVLHKEESPTLAFLLRILSVFNKSLFFSVLPAVPTDTKKV